MNQNSIVIGLVVVVALLGIGFWGMTQNPVSDTQTSTSTPQDQENISQESENTEVPTKNPKTMTVGIGLIALEDNGASGRAIGCNDSVVLVEKTVPYSLQTLQMSLNQLLSAGTDTSELYNALANSNLVVDELAIQNGVATIALSGQLSLGGVCDNPRVQAQLEETALQFETVQSVDIYLNGKPLAEALSLE